MKWFEVTITDLAPKVVAADYWIVENGFLTFCKNVDSNECPDVAVFAPGYWLCVTPVPGAERPEGNGDQG